jgi:RNA polymerase sigma-70 factor (ECF subfamily)
MPRSPASIPDASDAALPDAPRVPASASPHGAAHSWDSALETYYVELCEYVLRLVGSAEAAQDLVHDLFLHLWNTRGPRDAERLTRPYLYASARNTALKYLRHRRVVEAWIERASREEMPTADSPSDLFLQRELEDAVAHAIGELPARCREIFLLRRRDQLSYQEIAARAGVSLGTVKCHMWRAMVMLREKLAPYLAVVSPVIAENLLGRYPL